jgi:hypothetical protein
VRRTPAAKNGARRPEWAGEGAGISRQFWYRTEPGHPGWRVQHCGHPTALYPWAVVDPEGALHVNPYTSRAFHLVLEAQLYVEHMASREKPARFARFNYAGRLCLRAELERAEAYRVVYGHEENTR